MASSLKGTPYTIKHYPVRTMNQFSYGLQLEWDKIALTVEGITDQEVTIILPQVRARMALQAMLVKLYNTYSSSMGVESIEADSDEARLLTDCFIAGWNELEKKKPSGENGLPIGLLNGDNSWFWQGKPSNDYSCSMVRYISGSKSKVTRVATVLNLGYRALNGHASKPAVPKVIRKPSLDTMITTSPVPR